MPIAARRPSSSNAHRPRTAGLLPTTRSAFDVYLGEAGGYDLLSADLERAELCQIVALRRARWRALLVNPAAAAVRRWVLHDKFARSYPGSAIALLRKQWTASGTPTVLGEALAMQVDLLDLDSLLADRLEAVVTAAAPSGNDQPTSPNPVVTLGEQLRAARNRFACSNLRLVVSLASRRVDDRMSLADRVQEGNLGLLIAVSRFDPEHGVRFSTYAAWWIRFTIARALVNRGRSVRIPAHLHAIVSKARRNEQVLRAALGRDPTDQEVATATEIPVARLLDARTALEAREVALDEPEHPDHDDGMRGLGSFASHSIVDRDAEIDGRRNLAITHHAVATLNPMERDIIEQRFGLGGAPASTLTTIGERYALSRERIRQVQNQALAKLRVALESSPVRATAYA